MNKPGPHPLNVSGPFYVRDGCCMICRLPEELAPSLIGFDEGTQHCFVKRQPTTHAELGQMLDAVNVSEAQCVRYAGEDGEVLVRLVERGERGACDALRAAE